MNRDVRLKSSRHVTGFFAEEGEADREDPSVCPHGATAASGQLCYNALMSPIAPRAYRAYDRAELDRQYNARESVADFDAEMRRYREVSEQTKREHAHHTLVYDDASGETLDFFPGAPGAPVFLWIHGGYWRALSKDDNAFVVPGLAAHGFAVAVVNYTLAPAVSLDEIVRQVRSAVAYLHRERAALGLPAGPLAAGGSSAGGHLTGMLLAGDWQDIFDVPRDIVGVGLALSGLHDLEPIRHSYVNEVIGLDKAAAHRNSPIHCIPKASDAILLASVGGLETSEFHRQTADYVRAWTAAGHQAKTIDMPGTHHFDIALSLREPEGALARAVVAAMRR